MDVKKVMLIVAAIIVALGAAFAVNSYMRGATAPAARAAAAPAIDGPKIMVATRALPVGTILTADALRYQPWPQDLVKPDEYYVEGQADIANLAGSVVRVAVTAGAPVTKGSLVNPGDRGFLAAALGPGMRAVTVPMSVEQGVGGFVFPGDKVDLLYTLEIVSEENSAAKLYTTSTIVRNLRVLAVDQRTTPTDAAGATTPTIFATVTMEATPQIAERISVAARTGTLSLALRSIADTPGELEEAIASGQVSVGRDGDRRAEARLLGARSSRPEAGGGAGTTGADVSRHLRRDLPRMSVSQGPSNGGGNAQQGNGPSPQQGPVVPIGPTVRVVRGDQVTIVPVRGN